MTEGLRENRTKNPAPRPSNIRMIQEAKKGANYGTIRHVPNKDLDPSASPPARADSFDSYIASSQRKEDKESADTPLLGGSRAGAHLNPFRSRTRSPCPATALPLPVLALSLAPFSRSASNSDCGRGVGVFFIRETM